MQQQVTVLGKDFSEWAILTEEYAVGMEALRQGEPGASARMMAIARQMTQYSHRVCDQALPPFPRHTSREAGPAAVRWGWFTSALQSISVFH